MRCSQCHTAKSDHARFCMSCGVPLTPVGIAPRTPTTSIDFRRLGPGDLVAGGATVLLFTSLFLPWYRYGFSGSSITISAMGTGAGGWRVLILLLCIVIVGYLFTRTIWDQPQLPIPHWQMLAVLTILNALLAVVAFLVNPGAGITGTQGVDITWSYGAYIGVVVALVEVGGAFQYSLVIGDAAAAFIQNLWQNYSPTDVSPKLASRASRPAYQRTVPIVKPPVPTSICSNCSTALVPGNQFCTGCGTPISPPASPIDS